MPLRIATTIITGQGEQTVIDCCQWNPVTGKIEHDTVEDMEQLMHDMLHLSDQRMYELNMRMLHAYRFETYFDPLIWNRITHILEVLAGRLEPQYVINLWKSSTEETTDLERARAEHATKLAVQRALAAQGIMQMQCGCTVENETVTLCSVHEKDYEPSASE